jgi:hypothetical protein
MKKKFEKKFEAIMSPRSVRHKGYGGPRMSRNETRINRDSRRIRDDPCLAVARAYA